MQFRPMLAAPADLAKLRYPLLASPKLDGIRCAVVEAQALTRSLKPIPNRFIRQELSHGVYTGLDGELIFGDPTAKDVYLKTNSAVMAHEGEPEVTYYVFDVHSSSVGFQERQQMLSYLPRIGRIKIVALEQRLIHSEADLLAYEERVLDQGYEGLILRSVDGLYKHGRSTVKEGGMLKLKRFEDAEAEILEVIEQMHNANAATVNELGYTDRSTARAGLIGKDTLGAFRVRDLKTGVEFQIGTGFNDALRAQVWAARDTYVGAYVKYKFFACGVKESTGVPRHPVFLGFRDAKDLTSATDSE